MTTMLYNSKPPANSTVVIIRSDPIASASVGCCGPFAKCQWVVAYNFIAGVINLIGGGVIASQTEYLSRTTYVQLGFWQAIAGLAIFAGILLIMAGVVLTIGLVQNNHQMLSCWLGIIVVYLIIAMAMTVLDIIILTSGQVTSQRSPAYTVVSGIIFLVVQILCIAAVTSYKRILLSVA